MIFGILDRIDNAFVVKEISDDITTLDKNSFIMATDSPTASTVIKDVLDDPSWIPYQGIWKVPVDDPELSKYHSKEYHYRNGTLEDVWYTEESFNK